MTTVPSTLDKNIGKSNIKSTRAFQCHLSTRSETERPINDKVVGAIKHIMTNMYAIKSFIKNIAP